MGMFKCYCDFESFYDDTYSLRRMTAIEYILDPRFEALGAGMCIDDGEPFWVGGPDLGAFFAKQDWSQTIFISHNAAFDASILAWRYGHIPALYVDTLAMCRALIYHKTGSASLAACAKHLGLGDKLTTVLKLKGYRYENLIANGNLHMECIVYAMDDVSKCRGIFKELRDYIPRTEWGLMDDIVHMVTCPKFVLDQGVLTQHLASVQAAKEELLRQVTALGGSKDMLMSNDMFASLLRSLGVEPPTKISPVTGKVAYAFAKTDEGFQELIEHDDPNVQAVAAARVGHRSTIEETRTQRFISIANLPWPNERSEGRDREPGSGVNWHYKQLMPVPLRYSGAHTHRLSGDWQLNLQNLGRDSPLRRALTAPEGHVVVAADSAQIEARLTAWLAGCDALVTPFARGEDVYSLFASQVFGRPVNKKEHPKERFLGKTSILGLGYGMGFPKFQHTVKLLSKHILGEEITLTDDQAAGIVNLYRTRFAQIPLLWAHAEALLWSCLRGTMQNIGPVWTRQNEIVLPNGYAVRYHNLRREHAPPDEGFFKRLPREEWKYDYGRETKKLFGGKVVENIIQALARIVVMDVRGRMRELWPAYRLTGTSHDSLAYVVRQEDAQQFAADLEREMCVEPVWAPGLPLGVETGVGKNLAEAEGK